MASYSRGSRGGSDIARRVSQLESRIENIDKHIMLSFNIIKNALKGGNLATRKLGAGSDIFKEASNILDFKPSEGDSILLAQEVCFATPGDAITKAAVEMRDNGLPGPWQSWSITHSV